MRCAGCMRPVLWVRPNFNSDTWDAISGACGTRNGAMASVQIQVVVSQAYLALGQRAAASHQCLQESYSR